MANTIKYDNLTQYTNQLSIPMQTESVLTGRTMEAVTIQQGVKYKDAINVMNSTLYVKAQVCGAFGASGSVIPSQRELTATTYTAEESICITPEFESYWMGQAAALGSYNENPTAAFLTAYYGDKAKKIAKNIEHTAWKADSVGTYSSAYTLGQGYLSVLQNNPGSASVINGSTQTGAPTIANIYTIVWDMINNIPDDIREEDNLVLRMNYNSFSILCKYLADNNLFHFLPNRDQGGDSLIDNFMGQNVRIEATAGLNGVNHMLLTTDSNLYAGVDSLSDPQNWQTWFERTTWTFNFKAIWKLAFNVAYPQYCVLYKG